MLAQYWLACQVKAKHAKKIRLELKLDLHHTTASLDVQATPRNEPPPVLQGGAQHVETHQHVFSAYMYRHTHTHMAKQAI